ncbi:MAG: FtsW/RodA/SpoVE family cell cycle protein [Clostridiales bacterium]|jgi:cell division protein FtsW (lipid II flippase)|nr:FtsW/RodA/SpoVE family cell cycle protein [Clostridiales bacterium]
MFQFVIIVCRYLFVLNILYFLLEGVAFLLDERNIREWDRNDAITKQKGILILTHLTGFLLLGYKQGSYIFDWNVLVMGAASLAFLLVGLPLVKLVYKNSCPLMWNGVFFLLDLGLITLQRLDPDIARRQLIFIGAGFAAMLLIPLVFKMIPKWEKLEPVYLILSFLLLLLPFFLGKLTYGSLNWITIGSLRFQPSEIVKFLFVLYLASVFRKNLTLRQLIAPTAAAAAAVIILTVQRDLGGALIFFMTFMILLYVSTGRELLFFSGLLAASGVAWLTSKTVSHVQARVAVWLDPWADPYNKGYQIVQSLIAIASGGLWGSGLTRGAPRVVPVVNSDFIFSAICEEFGGLFGIGVFGIFIMVFYRGMHIALRCQRPYHSLLATGYTSLLALQTFLILGGVIKFIPLTGVTLPFISSGGSSVIVSILMIGILQWLYQNNHDDLVASEKISTKFT